MVTLSVLLKPDVFQLEDIKSVKSVSLTSEMTTMSNVRSSLNMFDDIALCQSSNPKIKF